MNILKLNGWRYHKNTQLTSAAFAVSHSALISVPLRS